MKTIEDMAHEYAEALNDIADLLDMPTGSTSAQIVKIAGNRWASGMHNCHDQCSRAVCVLRRERDDARRMWSIHQDKLWELREHVRLTLMENMHLADGDNCTLKRLKDAIAFDLDFPENVTVHPPQVGCDASSDHDIHDETTYNEIP